MNNTNNFSVAGFYKLQITNAKTGELKREVPWFPNLITNQGLNYIGGGLGEWVGYCRVGAGSAAPTINDTGVQSAIGDAQGYTLGSLLSGITTTAPYFGWTRRSYVFASGTVTGNLSELSAGWGTDNSSAFSRTLITENGVPITITVLPEDILTVIYELRIYPKLVDQTSSVTINSIVHEVVSRAANITNASFWGGELGKNKITYNVVNSSGGNGMVKWFNGYIGTEFSSPSGTEESSDSVTDFPTADEYLLDTFYRDFSFKIGVNKANYGEAGIRSISWQMSSGLGKHQMQFTPPIMKTNENTLTLKLRYSWSRYVP